MQQQPKNPNLKIGKLRWSVVALVVTALLVFAGPALAQETQPEAEQAAADKQKPAAGLVVIRVEADSPAEDAGVTRGDIILAVDDDAVNTMAELKHVILSHEPGDVLVLTVMHGDEERSLSVTLGDKEGYPVLGLMAVGDLAIEKKIGEKKADAKAKQKSDRPGRGGRGQGRMPAMPFYRGQMPDMPFGRGQMPGMPFGRSEGLMWMDADGALVMDVMEENAAATAGLQAGDIITGLNDATVASSDELVALLGDHSPGDVVTVTYERDGETATAEVTLGAHPDDEAKAYLGVQLAPAGPVRLHMGEGMMPFGFGEGMGEGMMPFGFGEGMGEGMMPFGFGEEMMAGVHLAAVTEDGPAAAAGLEAGDWITAVNGEEISDPQALVDAVKAAEPGDEIVLTVQSEDDAEATDVTVTLGENDEGGALLGVQIGGAMRIQRGPGGMDFDFHRFHGQGLEEMMPFFHRWGEGREGMPQMPFFFGRPGSQEDGGRFEFRAPQFRFQTPEGGEDASVPSNPGYATEGA